MYRIITDPRAAQRADPGHDQAGGVTVGGDRSASVRTPERRLAAHFQTGSRESPASAGRIRRDYPILNLRPYLCLDRLDRSG